MAKAKNSGVTQRKGEELMSSARARIRGETRRKGYETNSLEQKPKNKIKKTKEK